MSSYFYEKEIDKIFFDEIEWREGHSKLDDFRQVLEHKYKVKLDIAQTNKSVLKAVKFFNEYEDSIRRKLEFKKWNTEKQINFALDILCCVSVRKLATTLYINSDRDDFIEDFYFKEQDAKKIISVFLDIFKIHKQEQEILKTLAMLIKHKEKSLKIEKTLF